MDRWVELRKYPGYFANENLGIWSERLQRPLRAVQNNTGTMTVGLVVDGVQVKRSLAKLIAEAFLPMDPDRPFFDTPIHLDGDKFNCKASNLLWRPRWFAQQHTRQFRIAQPKHGAVMNLLTEEVYETCWPFVKATGLLYRGVISSAREDSRVFPTSERFRFAE